jgi:hypothetical protein
MAIFSLRLVMNGVNIRVLSKSDNKDTTANQMYSPAFSMASRSLLFFSDIVRVTQ